MTSKTQTLRFERQIAAPIQQVYQAFTKGASLREWLSDTAQVQAQPKGLICLTWRSGQFVGGHYKKLEKDKQVQMSWQSSFGPSSGQSVQVDLAMKDGGTELKLAHAGLNVEESGQQDIDLIQEAWDSSLDNLKSVLEDGIDLRFYERPLLGILVGRLITAEIAAKNELPVTFGLELSGVVKGMGAEELGLGDKTIIASLDGIDIKSYDDLSAAIENKQANELVPIVYYQKGEHHTGELRLAGRPRPEIPATPQSLAEKAAHIYTKINAKLDELFGGVSEQAAAHKPFVDEWSAREVLAHLIAHEQHLAYWGAALEKAKGMVSYGAHHHQLVAAIAASYPDVATLRKGLEQIQKQNVAFLAGLPVEFVERKGSYHRMALNFLDENKQHVLGHFDQIAEALRITEEAKGE